MTRQYHVLLNRSFTRVPTKDRPEGGRFSSQSVQDKDAFVSWKRLKSFRRCVILAEPGAGKTAELKEVTKECRREGKAAFFIRIEYLAEGIRQSFEGTEYGSYEEFDQWLSNTEKGWIFLDSVDESKLTSPRNFERALRSLSQSLGKHSERANIFITSRPSEWRSREDLSLFNSYFPIEVGGEARDAATVYSLDGLDLGQIDTFLRARQVDFRDRFVTELKKQAATEFASRPRDLDDLIEFWKKFGRIGTPLELIENSVSTKLTEVDTTRDYHRPLAQSKAIDGARTLAAAATFQKDQRIRIPESEAEFGIEAHRILRNWPRLECTTLLDRPIFDDATYGTVRFHHRTVREFLTAEWLDGFIKAGKGRRKIENLLFEHVDRRLLIRPTGRQILPWLSHFDHRIREKVLASEPELLIEYGDPSRFNADIRESIVKHMTAQNREASAATNAISRLSIERFASVDILPIVKSLIRDVSLSETAQLFLLNLIEHGRFEECKTDVLRIARNRLNSQTLRVGALRAVSGIVDPESAYVLIDDIMGDSELLENFEAILCLLTCFPGRLPFGKLLTLLARVGEPTGPIQQSLTKGIKAYIDQCNTRQRERLFEALIRLKLRPIGTRGLFEEDLAYHWLQAPLEHLLYHLICARSERALRNDSLHILRRCNYISDLAVVPGGRSLKSAVSDWGDLNHSLFWYTIACLQHSRPSRDASDLVWGANVASHLWIFRRSDGAVFRNLAQELNDDKYGKVCCIMADYLTNLPNPHPKFPGSLGLLAATDCEIERSAPPSIGNPLQMIAANATVVETSFLSERSHLLGSGQNLQESTLRQIAQSGGIPVDAHSISELEYLSADIKYLHLALLLHSDAVSALELIKGRPPAISSPYFLEYAKLLLALCYGGPSNDLAKAIISRNGVEWVRQLYDQYLPEFVHYYQKDSTNADSILVDVAATFHGQLLSLEWSGAPGPTVFSQQMAAVRAPGDDLPSWTTENFIEFSCNLETRPRTLHDLFDFISFRLLDLKDEIELTDDSLGPLLSKAGDEMQLRNFVAKWLRDNSGLNYSITQEEELSSRRRRDISVLGQDFDGRVTIEIKIADNRSGNSLFSQLKTQLIDGYLKEPRANRGIYLLLCRRAGLKWTGSKWQGDASFDDLIHHLQNEADNYTGSFNRIISVVGINLTLGRPVEF